MRVPRTCKERTQVASTTTEPVFMHRAEPINAVAELTNVWSIQHIWRILIERLARGEYSAVEQ